MSNPSKNKGTRFENDVVRRFMEGGIAAERVPLSGSLGGSHQHDVVLPDGKRLECKKRKDETGFRCIRQWKGEADALVVGVDRDEPFVYLTLKEFIRLKGIEQVHNDREVPHVKGCQCSSCLSLL